MDAETVKVVQVKRGRTEVVPTTLANDSYYDTAGNRIKYFQISEVRELINRTEAVFYKMVYMFLFETAARVSEAREVRFKDIDFTTNKIKLITLKQRRNKGAMRILLISDTLKSLILMHQINSGLTPDDNIFSKSKGGAPVTQQAISKMMAKNIKAIFGEAYLDRAHPHCFRHSRAINLLDSGMNIVKLQTVLGHASIQNTLIYLRYSNAEVLNGMNEANKNNGVQ